MRTIGFVSLAQGLLTIAVMRTRLPPRKAGPLVEWAALKEVTYVLYCLGMFLNFWGLYFAFYYVRSLMGNRLHCSLTDKLSGWRIWKRYHRTNQ